MSETTREILGHLDVDKVWRDREGDLWHYVEAVGWCWSRDGSVINEPAIPVYADGPFIAVDDAPGEPQ